MRLPALGEQAPEGALVVGERVLTPEGLGPWALTVREGRIAGMRPARPADRRRAWLDAGQAVLLPGFVDAHVHLNEPGRTEWEGFATGTRAAAAGGITTLVDMPLNSDPVTTTRAALQAKQAAAAGQCWVDLGFWGGVVPGNTPELAGMAAAGARGFKCFLCPSGIDDFPPVDEAGMREAMRALAALGLPLLVHAELCPAQTADPPPSRRYADYLQSRPARWEVDAIEQVIRLCAETGCAAHIVHLSAAEALPRLRAARARGLPITVETCPHYLSFTAEEVPDGATWFKCAPPIREAQNREALWQGLLDGDIDQVVCDHSPCTPALKHLDSGDFMAAWGGIASLQIAPAVLWGQAQARGVDLSRFSTWTAAAPARLAGLAGVKGTLQLGADADLVVWDPDACEPLRAERLLHRHPLSPYVGRTLRGAPRATVLRGALTALDHQLAAPHGALLSPRTPDSP